MHPNPHYHSPEVRADRALHEALLDEIAFGMVFAATPDGPRVVHVPLVSTGDGAVQFHIARGNALYGHLDGATALAVVNGPDAYVSARWYNDPDQVPTWNYVALELEGRVRRMGEEALAAHIDDLVTRHEARVEGGEPWSLGKMDQGKFRTMLGAIAGFEMEVAEWRPTLKLSQNKPPEVRGKLADHLEAQGAPAIAELMRGLGDR